MINELYYSKSLITVAPPMSLWIELHFIPRSAVKDLCAAHPSWGCRAHTALVLLPLPAAAAMGVRTHLSLQGCGNVQAAVEMELAEC